MHGVGSVCLLSPGVPWSLLIGDSASSVQRTLAALSQPTHFGKVVITRGSLHFYYLGLYGDRNSPAGKLQLWTLSEDIVDD